MTQSTHSKTDRHNWPPGRIPVEAIFINKTLREGLQVQLTSAIVEVLLESRAEPGTKIPSSRELAAHLGISRLTVTLVYQELLAQGYLESLPRSGYVVASKVPHRRMRQDLSPSAIRPVHWGDWLRADLKRHRQIVKPADWRSYPYPFIYGQPDARLFNHSAWRDCARRTQGSRDFAAMADDQYGRDDPMLVDYICRNTLPRRGIRPRPEEVLITLGAQNALYMAISLLARPNRTAVIEDPGYPDFAETLRMVGMPVLASPIDDSGLDPAGLPPDTGLVIVTPSHNIPTGLTMPFERRAELLAAADRQDFLIIEDDYEFEMSFLAPHEPSLKSLDQSGRVIYIGSFSKSLFPGLRLGYLVGPEPFIREARALRSVTLRHTPGHMQRVTGYFLALGYYDAHVVGLRHVFRKRREALVESLAGTDFTIAGAARHGGSSLWIEGPEGLDSARFAAQLTQAGVLIEPGRPFFANPPEPCRFFRMGYSSIAENEIRAGVAAMTSELARFSRQG